MIFCPECGTPNPDEARFCKNCGKDFAEVIKEQRGQRQGNIQKKPQAEIFRAEPAGAPHSHPQNKGRGRGKSGYEKDYGYIPPSYGKKRRKSSKGLIAAVITELICIGLIIGGFYVAGVKKSSPEQVAEKYFRAVAEKDWDTAYDMTDIPEGKFFGRKAYATVMGNTYDMRIDSYKVKTKRRGSGDKVEITVDYIKEDGGKDTLGFTLLKQDEKTMLFFPTWMVSSKDQIYKGYKIYNVPKGTKLVYDGIALTEEDKAGARDRKTLKPESTREHGYIEPGEESCVDMYSIDVFKGVHEVQTAVPWCRKSVRYCRADEDGGQEGLFEEEEAFDITLTEKGERMIKIKMQNALKRILTAAVNEKSFTEVEDLFARDYISQCEETYDYFCDSSYDELEEWDFYEFQYQTDYDDEEHKFYTEMRFSVTERWISYYDGGSRYYYDDAVMKAHFVFEDGDYKISDFEI